MDNRSNKSPRFLLYATLIFLLAAALRLIAVTNLPLFIDEAFHISRTHAMIDGDLYVGNIRKWFYPTALIPFQPTGPESVWLARSATALISMVNVAGCMSLGRTLGDQRAGLLAGLFYAVFPLALFHERQALSDPLLTAFITLMILASFWLVHRPQWWQAVILALAMAGAYLTKIAALPFLIVPLMVVMLFADQKVQLKALGWTIGAMVVAGGIIWWQYQTYYAANPLSDSAGDLLVGRVTDLVGPGQEQYTGNLLLFYWKGFSSIVWRYVGLPMLVMVLLGLVWLIKDGCWRSAVILGMTGIVLAFVPLLAINPADFFASRYILPNGVALVVLGALGWRMTGRHISSSHIAGWIYGIGAGLIVLPGLWFGIQMMVNPAEAPLTGTDKAQYFTSDASGIGRDELSRYFITLANENPGTPIAVLSTGSVGAWLDAEVGSDIEYLEKYRPGDPFIPPKVIEWMATDKQVYVVESGEQYPLENDSPLGMQLTQLASYESQAGSLNLFRVNSISGKLADEIAAARTPDPEKLQTDYDALNSMLDPSQPVIVYPANHAVMVNGSDVIPLSVDTWPLMPTSLDVVEIADGTILNVVSVDEAHSDPNRILLRTLVDSFYLMQDEWFGLLHHRGFVAGGEPSWEPMLAHYEQVIELVSAGVLDKQVVAGGIVRMALQWRSSIPVKDSFVVFVHVVDADGNLVTQHDGIPGGGLYPMTSWEPDELITDRFAIHLPDNVAPGFYTLRVGIYHPVSGLRLPVTDGLVYGPDYVVVGHIEVQ